MVGKDYYDTSSKIIYNKPGLSAKKGIEIIQQHIEMEHFCAKTSRFYNRSKSDSSCNTKTNSVFNYFNLCINKNHRTYHSFFKQFFDFFRE